MAKTYQRQSGFLPSPDDPEVGSCYYRYQDYTGTHQFYKFLKRHEKFDNLVVMQVEISKRHVNVLESTIYSIEKMTPILPEQFDEIYKVAKESVDKSHAFLKKVERSLTDHNVY